jgi:hypothetical protein
MEKVMNLPLELDLETLVAQAEVREMMRADHVVEVELLAELNTMSVQRLKNTRPIFPFDRAVCRLQNMSEMISRLGLDNGAFARQDFDLGATFGACQGCVADEVCRDWLGRAPKSISRAPAFCTNAERFARAKGTA